MNAFADFSLESFLTVENAGQAKPQQPRYALPRVLLASSGGLAQVVCSGVLTLAAEWLGVEPPIAHWEVSADGQIQADAAATLLDRIAQRNAADALRLAGYELQNPEELVVWVVVSADAGNLPDPNVVDGVVDLLRKLAWTRMRAQVAMRVLALTEPANDMALQQWHRQVASATPSIYLCSPVNLHHLRLTDDDYTGQTATALAALICGNFPSHARTADSACVAVGAVGWTAPIPAIRRGLALLSALNAVAALQANLDAIETGVTGAESNGATSSELAAPRLPGMEQSDLELAASVSPAQAAVRWRDLGVGWEDLADLSARVQERLERREARHEQTLRQERQAWLSGRMELWQGILADVDRLQEPDGDAPPPLHRQRLNLRLLEARLKQDLDTLAAAFDRNDQRLQNAEEQVNSAWVQVEKLCAQLPPATTKGILMAALQPWMWPIWPYALRALLPQEGQKVLDGVALRGKVRWHEANWHVLRQAALAMNQDVNQRLRALDQVSQYVLALRTQLIAKLAQVALPAPWTPATLRALWSAAKTQTPVLATFPAQERPSAWLAETPENCAERLAGGYYPATAFVEQWSVLDCLAQPFLLSDENGAKWEGGEASYAAAPAEPSLPANCLAWLNGLVETALPLWPEPALTPVSGPVGWCLLPQPVTGVADSGYAPDSLRQWCEAVVNLAPATLPGRTLAILRWAPVAVDEWQAVDSLSI